MKKLPSSLFPNCEFANENGAGFFEIIPHGFDHEVSIYLSAETVRDDKAVERAAAFFDKAAHWDTLCRKLILSFEEDSEDYETVEEFFEFYKDEAPEVFSKDFDFSKDEAPEVFSAGDVSSLSLEAMVSFLRFKGMGAHEGGMEEENYVVDFTLGYDWILCVTFDSESNFDYISWES